LRHTRHFADGRRLSDGKKSMNRLYVVESTPTITGAMAEHRLPLASGEIANLARMIADRLDGKRSPATDVLSGAQSRWLDWTFRDLHEHRGASIVIAGECQPPEVHALAHLL